MTHEPSSPTPHVTLRGEPVGSKVTFRDLYVNTLFHSPRASQASRDKLSKSPTVADEFAKISLLTNVGRINTTMSCKYRLRISCKAAQRHSNWYISSIVADASDDRIYPWAY